MKRAVIIHGGALSNPNHKDGTDKAAEIAMTFLRNGKTALDAAVKAVEILENDPRFNAGIGSVVRKDGKTVQMDAACMESNGAFGAVAAISMVKNPILVARKVMDTSTILLTGKGAEQFAYQQGFVKFDIHGKQKEHATDTVGAVVYDGENFASALSSGGLAKSQVGRVGDVPLPGCGLFCGQFGAIASTGDGEYIAKQILAYKVYNWLTNGVRPEEASKSAVSLFPDAVSIGIIVLTNKSYGITSKCPMAYSFVTEN